jgi:hypothetical protein
VAGVSDRVGDGGGAMNLDLIASLRSATFPTPHDRDENTDDLRYRKKPAWYDGTAGEWTAELLDEIAEWLDLVLDAVRSASDAVQEVTR